MEGQGITIIQNLQMFPIALSMITRFLLGLVCSGLKVQTSQTSLAQQKMFLTQMMVLVAVACFMTQQQTLQYMLVVPFEMIQMAMELMM
jgi:hypothetical protein